MNELQVFVNILEGEAENTFSFQASHSLSTIRTSSSFKSLKRPRMSSDKVNLNLSSTNSNKAVNRGYPAFAMKAENSWTGPFYFIQAADTQLGLITNYGDGTIDDQYPNVTWDKELELCRQSVQIINSLKPPPKFVVLCGDMLDAPPDQWPEVRKRQLKDFIQVFQVLDPSIPMISLCGNADLGNTPTKASLDEYKSTFGDDYFAFWVDNVHFIALNSQLFEDVPELSDLASVQNQWLDEQLELSKARQSKHIMIFQHIPLFVDDPEEEKTYFNIELEARMNLLSKFKRYGVSKIFAGHVHENAGGWDETLEMMVTTAIGCQLGEDVHGMRIVKVFENEIIHEFHGLERFPQKIDLKPRPALFSVTLHINNSTKPLLRNEHRLSQSGSMVSYSLVGELRF